MEKLEYQDDTIPLHVAHFLRQRKEAEALALIEKQERPHLDDNDMREIEP